MDDCVLKLRRLIEEIESLKATDSNNPKNDVWKGKVLRLVKKCFGENSDYVKEIEDVLNPGIIVTNKTPDSYWTKLHLDTLTSAEAHLKGYLEDLEQTSEDQTNNIQIDDNPLAKVYGNYMQNRATPLEKLELLFTRFHMVAKNLTRRYDDRSTFQIGDEYDVQDLLRSLMAIFFDDIRLEEITPGYASKSVKMDFLLNKEEIVVECKMARVNHTEKKISDELIIDIARYVKHARCKRLVCLIYDPAELIHNKSVLYDLQDKSTPVFSINVYVIP